MRHSFTAILSLCTAALLAAPAMAQEITEDVLVFERGLWTVSRVAMDDGTRYCVAEVVSDNAWVTIWIEQDGTTGIEFNSEDWGYDISTETFVATIDNRRGRNLANPDISGNSVYFHLPDDKTSIAFLGEVRDGRELYLNNKQGELIAKFPLTGSSASIGAVVDCVDRL